MINKKVYIILIIVLTVFAFVKVMEVAVVDYTPSDKDVALIDEGGEQGKELSDYLLGADAMDDVYSEEYEIDMKIEKVDDNTLKELLRNSMHLDGDWYYIYEYLNKEINECGFDNLVLINKKEKGVVYIFDRKVNYFNCLKNYFNFDKDNQALYLIRSNDSSVDNYGFDLKTLKLIKAKEYLGTNNSKEVSKFAQKIEGDLDLRYSIFAEGLKLPQEIGGSLFLPVITSARELELPQKIVGDLYLDGLLSAEGLKLPQEIGGDLDLSILTSVEDLKLPQNIGGSLYLSSLISVRGLEFPQKIGGDIDLRMLISAEGLKLPQEIGGGLYLSSLTSARGLVFPQKMGRDNDIDALSYEKKVKSSQQIGGRYIISNFISDVGLEIPKEIEGGLVLRSLATVEGLKLPQEIRGSLDLSSLTSIECMDLIQDVKISGKIYFKNN